MVEAFAIDQKTIEKLVLNAVQDNILTAIESMSQDPAWLARIEQMINQTVVQQTVARIGSMDINTVIKERVDANMDIFREKLLTNFTSIGISDQATKNQMTVTDDHTVFDNNLVTKNLTVADSAQIQNLVVTGSINTDNASWVGLIADLADKTLEILNDDWKEELVSQVAEKIKTIGIDFSNVTIDGEPLVNGNSLASTITQTNIQRLGTLGQLTVAGETHLNETVNVIRKRVGINTEEPEMALSIWDEEVAVNIGKNKLGEAYFGTSRAQSLVIGTNRVGHLEIDAEGMTQVKKLRIGVHQISHGDMVPGWSGTRGDIVFNTNMKEDRVFAWLCLGNYKWQPLKSAE